MLYTLSLKDIFVQALEAGLFTANESIAAARISLGTRLNLFLCKTQISLKIWEVLRSFNHEILGFFRIEIGQRFVLRRRKQGSNVDMGFFFARISVNMRVFFMWVIRQIVDVVQSLSPDAHHANIRRNLDSRFPHFDFNLEFLRASFLLINNCVDAARVD